MMKREPVPTKFWFPPTRAAVRALYLGQPGRSGLAPFFFLLPAGLMFAVFVVSPIVQSIWTSFYNWDGISRARWVGLGNYAELLRDEEFYTALWNNAKWLAVYMLAPPIGLLLALFLDRKLFGIRIVKSMFFLPFVLSSVVVGMVFNWFYAPGFGLLTVISQWLGFGEVSILSSPYYATYGIITAGLWPQIAFCMIIYLTGLTAVNGEVVEAARIDAAKGWKMVWYILLPQLRPATFLAMVVTVIGALRSFDLIAIMTKGGPFASTKVLAFKMYEEAMNNFRAGYGAAYAVVLFVIVLGYTAFALTRMLRGEE
jgi:multiple sugar transport system permease protein